MGTTHSETRTPEQRNRTTLSLKRYYVFVYCILSALSACAIINPITERSIANQTLKMCNQRPAECKFKYDILMYQETGKIPTQGK